MNTFAKQSMHKAKFLEHSLSRSVSKMFKNQHESTKNVIKPKAKSLNVHV